MDIRKKVKRLVTGSGTRFLALLILILSGTFAAFGQQITGTIVGTVKDAARRGGHHGHREGNQRRYRVLALGARQRLGEYRIDYLPVGNYTVEATAPSFERFVQKNICSRRRPGADG